MSQAIVFPEAEPQYDFKRDCLVFCVLADGRPVECLVTAKLLAVHFGARDMGEESMRQAYHEDKTEVQDLSRNHIENGWIDEEGRIFLTTNFTRLRVTFGERLGPELEKAHRILLELIGPNAREIAVEWDADQEPQGCSRIRLRLTDPSIQHSVATVFGPKDLQDPSLFRVYLARSWGSLLQARTRKQILKMG